jgi:hypothetical protein
MIRCRRSAAPDWLPSDGAIGASDFIVASKALSTARNQEANLPGLERRDLWAPCSCAAPLPRKRRTLPRVVLSEPRTITQLGGFLGTETASIAVSQICPMSLLPGGPWSRFLKATSRSLATVPLSFSRPTDSSHIRFLILHPSILLFLLFTPSELIATAQPSRSLPRHG